MSPDKHGTLSPNTQAQDQPAQVSVISIKAAPKHRGSLPTGAQTGERFSG